MVASVRVGMTVVGIVTVGIVAGRGVGRLSVGRLVGMVGWGISEEVFWGGRVGGGKVGNGGMAEAVLGADAAELLWLVGAEIPAEGTRADGNGSGSRVGKGTMMGIGLDVGALWLALLG